MIIIHKTENTLIYWDEEKKKLFYEAPDENYISEVLMIRNGFFNLDAEETEAINSFIDKLVKG